MIERGVHFVQVSLGLIVCSTIKSVSSKSSQSSFVNAAVAKQSTANKDNSKQTNITSVMNRVLSQENSVNDAIQAEINETSFVDK